MPSLFYSPARAAHLERVRTFFERHGARTVFIGRFIAVLRTWAAIFAGAAEMPFADENCATLVGRLNAPLLGRVPHLQEAQAETQAASALPYLDFSSLLS